MADPTVATQPADSSAGQAPVETGAAPAAPVETPAVEAPATAEAASAESGIKETLLETVSKELAAEAAPKVEDPAAAPAAPAEGEKKPEEAAAKVEGDQPKAPEPVPLDPIDYKFVAPEGFEINDERKGELTAALDAFRSNPIEGAQGLLDLHSKAVVEAVNKVRGDQTELFNNTLADWEKQIMADPEVGGAGFETAKRAVARVRDAAVPEKDRPDFEHFLRVTGAGSHPAFWRMMHNLAAFVDEPQSREMPSGILPPKNIGKAPAGARREESFYDHPRGNMDS
jgi:hypothetical protein